MGVASSNLKPDTTPQRDPKFWEITEEHKPHLECALYALIPFLYSKRDDLIPIRNGSVSDEDRVTTYAEFAELVNHEFDRISLIKGHEEAKDKLEIQKLKGCMLLMRLSKENSEENMKGELGTKPIGSKMSNNSQRPQFASETMRDVVRNASNAVFKFLREGGGTRLEQFITSQYKEEAWRTEALGALNTLISGSLIEGAKFTKRYEIEQASIVLLELLLHIYISEEGKDQDNTENPYLFDLLLRQKPVFQNKTFASSNPIAAIKVPRIPINLQFKNLIHSRIYMDDEKKICKEIICVDPSESSNIFWGCNMFTLSIPFNMAKINVDPFTLIDIRIQPRESSLWDKELFVANFSTGSIILHADQRHLSKGKQKPLVFFPLNFYDYPVEEQDTRRVMLMGPENSYGVFKSNKDYGFHGKDIQMKEVEEFVNETKLVSDDLKSGDLNNRNKVIPILHTMIRTPGMEGTIPKIHPWANIDQAPKFALCLAIAVFSALSHDSSSLKRDKATNYIYQGISQVMQDQRVMNNRIHQALSETNLVRNMESCIEYLLNTYEIMASSGMGKLRNITKLMSPELDKILEEEERIAAEEKKPKADAAAEPDEKKTESDDYSENKPGPSPFVLGDFTINPSKRVEEPKSFLGKIVGFTVEKSKNIANLVATTVKPDNLDVLPEIKEEVIKDALKRFPFALDWVKSMLEFKKLTEKEIFGIDDDPISRFVTGTLRIGDILCVNFTEITRTKKLFTMTVADYLGTLFIENTKEAHHIINPQNKDAIILVKFDPPITQQTKSDVDPAISKSPLDTKCLVVRSRSDHTNYKKPNPLGLAYFKFTGKNQTMVVRHFGIQKVTKNAETMETVHVSEFNVEKKDFKDQYEVHYGVYSLKAFTDTKKSK